MAENALIPLYQQIKEDIRTAIQSGKYQAGEKIPSEPALGGQYSVSRITIRRSIEELCDEGHLIKKQGLGTFVNLPRTHRKISITTQVESFTHSCASNGIKAGGKVLARKIVPAQKDEYEFLGIAPDELLLHLQRLRTVDGLPAFLENIFLPYQKYKELLTVPLDNVSLFAAIEKISGKRVSDISRQTIEVTSASVEQSRKMDIAVGEALFFLNCYFVDQDNNSVCIGRQYYVGNRYIIDI